MRSGEGVKVRREGVKKKDEVGKTEVAICLSLLVIIMIWSMSGWWQAEPHDNWITGRPTHHCFLPNLFLLSFLFPLSNGNMVKILNIKFVPCTKWSHMIDVRSQCAPWRRPGRSLCIFVCVRQWGGSSAERWGMAKGYLAVGCYTELTRISYSQEQLLWGPTWRVTIFNSQVKQNLLNIANKSTLGYNVNKNKMHLFYSVLKV